MAQDRLQELLGGSPAGLDTERIGRALAFAARAHEGQSRASGEPYIEHPLAVAKILVDLNLDTDTIVAALLHDVVEDTGVPLAQIEAEFGTDVAMLVDGVTKLSRLEVRSREEEQVENLRKMFLAMARDIRVILIKLADRLHNMRTLKHLPPERVERIARETREIYAPLANRLGIFRIKWELEDLAFQHLDPAAYREMREKVAKRRREREAEVEAAIAVLKDRLERAGIEAEVSGRAKHLYSIYQKMQKQGKRFEEIYDLIAVRVLVETVRDCYAVLGLVHEMWKPLPGRFKDYIAMPKSNMYQSLHTTVIGPSGEPFEVQIRTFEMHHTAEYGIAAHWRYKEDARPDRDFEQKLSWLRQLLEWQRDMRDAREFMETLKIDLFADEVFVFTPRGDVIELPAGATPVDFAYRIHTDVGHHCVGAKVNGRIVPLTTALQNGDIVEVMVNRSSPGPSPDWLSFVRTSQARSRIRQWLRRERRHENLVRGKEILERELRRAGLTLSEERLAEILKRIGAPGLEETAISLGEGTQSPIQLVHRIKEELVASAAPPLVLPRAPKTSRTAPPSEILVRGQSRLLVRFGRCCAPVPGDPVIGYLTRGRGVSVHRMDCPNLQNLSAENQERLVEVAWEVDAAEAPHPVEVVVTAWDRPGLLADVANAVATTNILNASARGLRDRTAVVHIKLEVRNLAQLNQIMDRIRALPYVLKVGRISRERA
ncbi:MAG: bifunctional (p)ppGpp synthetase/guanosine-3',5'-bis(diphosphate) 3'-pyrophosphohydrolase [Actinomycetia bacterium]|nr:bifunctional (p)ppGpp synthetase/guanosine-3',5'-bis(diphosphate) 3'-pyrophosphohydrolase [Actinomycetes bacterium]